MVTDVISESPANNSPSQLNKLGVRIQEAQERIYRFFLDIVKQKSPPEVVQEFRHLFIDYNAAPGEPEIIQAISELVFANNEKEYRDTIKRCCYILINNWYISRNHTNIQALVDLFTEVRSPQRTISPTLSRQRTWLWNFVNGPEYHELKLFVSRYAEKEHWSNRYQSYLLVPQYTNLNNPVEQREAARALSLKLKEQFKLELAMYTARSQSGAHKDRINHNPTALGDNVIDFIKKIVAKNGIFNHDHLAHIFLEQTKTINYECFKYSVPKYLVFSLPNNTICHTLEEKIAEKLVALYVDYHEQPLDDALLLRTCNRLIDYLTTEDANKPSELFIWLMSQSHHILLAILLLKIILICPNTRNHLETSIARLIEYYVNYPEEDCQWAIVFFEVFKIAFAIYADDVQYNLIKMDGDNPEEFSELDLDAYRVFSQLRPTDTGITEDDAKNKVDSSISSTQTNHLSPTLS